MIGVSTKAVVLPFQLDDFDVYPPLVFIIPKDWWTTPIMHPVLTHLEQTAWLIFDIFIDAAHIRVEHISLLAAIKLVEIFLDNGIPTIITRGESFTPLPVTNIDIRRYYDSVPQ